VAATLPPFSFSVYNLKMMRAVSLVILAALQLRATSVATVGDSFADAIYLGLKLQPDLLRKNGIELTRWSRPSIGLTRVDYFDYTSWLRDTAGLGSVDFCVVEMGANDLQSIAIAEKSQETKNPEIKKWIRVGTDDWQRAYTDRVQAFVRTLKPLRCSNIVWLLQPPYQKNKFLSQYHGMINSVQFAGSSPGAAVYEIDAGTDDYGPDGIHFNKDFCFKLARAVVNLFAPSRSPSAGTNCGSCHASPGLPPVSLRELAPLIPRQPQPAAVQSR
jgi:hypothetical protein